VAFKIQLYPTLFAAMLAATFAFAANGSTAATKKLTWEEAYKKCKAILDKEGAPTTTTQGNVRHTRGAACMKKYGYKL
jgi:hypothetical protein